MISHHRIFTLLTVRALAATATALSASGQVQLANGLPVAGPAALHLEQLGGEPGLWTASGAGDGTWSFSDPRRFGNLPGGTALGNNLNEFITPPQFKDSTRLFYRVRVGPATAQ